MSKRIIATLLSLAMLVTVVGCGAATDSAPVADEAVEETAEAVEDTVVVPVNGKVWKIATDTSFKPFEYTDENGDFVGIDMDILAAIAADQGFAYEIQVLGWDASIAACQGGEVDAMIAGASVTEERIVNGWIFSDGYYDANQSMAVKADSDITGFDGLNGKIVAAKTGTLSATYAESLAAEYGFTVAYYNDSPSMYQAVVDGQVAGCIDDTPIMASDIKDAGMDMKILEGTGNEPAAYGFAIFNTDNQELLDMFNAGLANIKSNGKYDEILAKYLG